MQGRSASVKEEEKKKLHSGNTEKNINIFVVQLIVPYQHAFLIISFDSFAHCTVVI